MKQLLALHGGTRLETVSEQDAEEEANAAGPSVDAVLASAAVDGGMGRSNPAKLDTSVEDSIKALFTALTILYKLLPMMICAGLAPPLRLGQSIANILTSAKDG